MSGNFCNNVHLSMDDTFIQWDEILGDPAKSTSLNAFIDQKLNGVEEALTDLVEEKLDAVSDTVIQDINEELEKIALAVDPYKIKYNNSTVGDTLDELTNTKFECTMGEYGPYEKGQKFPTFNVAWNFNKDVEKVVFERIRNSAPIEKHELKGDITSFNVANVGGTETFRVTGYTADGEMATASTTVEFKLRWYYGTHGFTKPTNKIIINWASNFVDFNTQFGRHIFDCESGAYIYYAFPDDLHKTYDFTTNGLRDNDMVWEVKNVTNQYGYVHPYRIYRTNNLLHGYNIYSEVESNDWY